MFKSRFFAIGLVIFSLAWLNANHYRPWPNFHSEALACISLSFLSVSLLVSKSQVSTPHLNVWIGITALLPWIQLISDISQFAGDALLGSFYQVGLLMAVMVGYSMAGQEPDTVEPGWLGLAHALWVAALLSAAVGLAQWFDLADSLEIYAVQTEIGARAVGNLSQPNQLATLLLMGIAAMIYVFEQKVIGKVALATAVTFMTGVLVLTQSRASMISVMAITAFLLWKQRISNLRLSQQAVLWWVGCFALATLCLPSVSEWLLMGGSRGLVESASISERWLIWKQVSYAIAQSPWLGYGWNQTPTANAVGALAFPGSTTYTNAHNIVLDLMVWCGIPLGLLLTGAMAYWTVSRLRSVKLPSAILAMAALLPIGIHSLLEFPFAYAYFLIAAGFFVGIVEAVHIPAKTFSAKVRWLWLFLGLWSGIGAYMVFEYFQIEEDFRIVRFENLHVGATPESYQAPQVWMLSHMAAMLKAARQVPKTDMSQADLENLRKVSDRFAYGAIRFKYAQALGLNGDPAGASKQMQIIHSMYGEYFYHACKDQWQRLTEENYPQLAKVKILD
jgi:O-antigen ligase